MQALARLRDKVLEAAVAEAVTELTDDKAVPRSITGAGAPRVPASRRSVRAKTSKPNAQTEWREREESNRAVFESRDADFRDAACHRNVISPMTA